eukprot:CAMPEP_0181297470 /NCGR_PEP_ID=MMETSP1101-20121128/5254_1 /TAXON_ID=46948 /ORGANISM="Rhodomonas abbreviata, Strain Caron Lab Isolate" /LENGTH=119 /DNA_ID=CAMNT_0023402403 /DNA_START=158 /DNA_END=516 /DNA_ORIENTATION=+
MACAVLPRGNDQDRGRVLVLAVAASSRNVPEEKLGAPRFVEVEDDAYGEVGKAISKWQRTRGPIYIQLVGGALLALGFINYFSWSNANGNSSLYWAAGILTAFLGFALQRGDTDKRRPY